MAKKPSTPRVQQFRKRMKENGNRRFEATIDAASIRKLQRLAYQRNLPIGSVLERAIDLFEADSGNTARLREG